MITIHFERKPGYGEGFIDTETIDLVCTGNFEFEISIQRQIQALELYAKLAKEYPGDFHQIMRALSDISYAGQKLGKVRAVSEDKSC